MEHGNEVGGYGAQSRAAAEQQPDARETVDPQAEITDLRRRLDALMVRLAAQSAAIFGGANAAVVEPEMDVYENDQAFLIRAAVPGASPEAIRVEAMPHTVTLSAETPARRSLETSGGAHSNVTRHRRSRHADLDRYHFVYVLQAPIVPELARAAFRHGIVEIHLPKASLASPAVTVPISFQDDYSLGQTLTTPAAAPSSHVLVVSAREGSPGQKLGASYVPSPGEDHTAKAQSIGEQPVPGRPAPSPSDRLRTAEVADPHSAGSDPRPGKLP